jgi:hypothetical protein
VGDGPPAGWWASDLVPRADRCLAADADTMLPATAALPAVAVSAPVRSNPVRPAPDRYPERLRPGVRGVRGALRAGARRRPVPDTVIGVEWRAGRFPLARHPCGTRERVRGAAPPGSGHTSRSEHGPTTAQSVSMSASAEPEHVIKPYSHGSRLGRAHLASYVRGGSRTPDAVAGMRPLPDSGGRPARRGSRKSASTLSRE